MKTILTCFFLFLLLPHFADAADQMISVDEDLETPKARVSSQKGSVADIVEKVEAPKLSQRGKRSNKRKREELVQGIQSMLESGEYDSAIAIYPLPNKNHDGESSDIFAQDLDRRFFKETSRKVHGGGLVAGLFGCIPPHPSCGFVIDKTGDFLEVPISSLQDKLFISWIVITTTPAFVQQYFVIGKRVTSWFFCEDSFDVSQGEKDRSKPHVFKKRKLHYAANIVLLGSTVISGAIPAILMRQVEIDFPVFVGVTIFPFYLAWTESYFMSGYANIHHLFEFYTYTSKINYQKREILKEKILDFQRALARDDFVLTVYDLIQKEKEANFSGEEGTLFAFSALFLKSSVRMMGTPEDGDEAAALLMNYKLDVDASAHSAFDDVSGWLSAFITGAGTYTRYYVNQNLLSSLFLEMGISPNAAFYASAGLAGFEAGYRLITSHYFQKDYLSGIKRIFRRNTNFTPIRKGASIVSFVNGSLFSLPALVAGLHVFKDYSLLSKIGYLTPAFLLDVMRYDGFFAKQYNDFVDSVSVARSNNLGVISKRAHLKSYSDKALYFMDQFDVETIEKLYTILQQGV